MMMKKLSLFLLFSLVSACTGVSQPSKFYSLQSENTGNYTNAKIRASIGITEVSLADYLDRPQISTVKANMIELDVSEYNRWSESLSTMIQRVIADDLAYDLPRAVVKPRLSVREKFDYLVDIELNKFDGSWKENVTLEAWWSITDQNGNIISRQKSVLSAPLKSGYDDLIRAQSLLLAELAEKIAKALAAKAS